MLYCLTKVKLFFIGLSTFMPKFAKTNYCDMSRATLTLLTTIICLTSFAGTANAIEDDPVVVLVKETHRLSAIIIRLQTVWNCPSFPTLGRSS